MQRAADSEMQVYRDGTENIVGVLHLRDFVQHWADDRARPPIAAFGRPPFYVPETQTVGRLDVSVPRST